MANSLYDSARNSFLTGGMNWSTMDVKVALVDANYTFDAAAHTVYADIEDFVVAESPNLTDKTAVGGVADAEDVVFEAVEVDADGTAMVMFWDNGTTKPLIAFFDTATGLPLVGVGDDETVVWNALGIFKL